MEDIAFAPKTLTLTNNAFARLEFANRGSLTHDFTVEQIRVTDVQTKDGTSGGQHHMDAAKTYPLHVAVDGGKTARLDFRPTATGEFEYFCTVAGHREAGMRGTLRVE